MNIGCKSTTVLARLIAKTVYRLLRGIEKGRLELVLPEGTVRGFGKEAQGIRYPRILVNDYRFFTRLAFGGEIGLGEAYVDGLWDCDDLTNAFTLLIENREALSDGNLAWSAVSRSRNYRLHRSKLNTVDGCRENIAAHYDLSADFYKTFLDETMTYSCGIFHSGNESLQQAQLNKMHSVMKKACIGHDDHVLEIGCGWGGFAVEAVRATGCRMTLITVSRAQYEYVREKVRQEGLEDRIEVLCEDYRTVRGLYDKIISIEMLEAVGHEHLGDFFERCEKLLKPWGVAVLQVITIPDARYERHRSQPNWIQKHIFPGGLLPSLTALCDAMTAHSRLQIEHVENIGIHYAQTLMHWRDRLVQAWDSLSRMGFDRTFKRTWLYYFSLCEAQFGLRVLNDLQIVLTREGNRSLRGGAPA